jgi:hypothetical protein
MTMGTVDAVDRGAALRIVLTESKGKVVVGLESGSDLPKIPTNLLWSRLEAFRDDLAGYLLKAVRATRALLDLSDWHEIDRAVNLLERIGSRMIFDLFDGPGEEVFLKFFARHVPYHPQWGPPAAYEPPLIEVEAADQYIPFGLLPVFESPDSGPIDNLPKLRQAMFRFLGMATVIRYVGTTAASAESETADQTLVTIDQDRLLLNEQKLPIKFFHDSTLYGATVEREFFAKMTEFIELDGPWPNDADHGVDQSNIAPRLAAALWRSSQRFDGSSRGPADQIHHLSCHCHVPPELAADYRLSLGTEDLGPFEISLHDLKASFQKLRKESPRRAADRSRPIIFINACGSSAGSPKGLPAFPQTFVESHRAMIGTEAKIPDEVAAAMCETFYLSLLGGRTVGKSLHDARWNLVDFNRNPLGILYTLHGDPGLRVSDPRPDLLL